MSKKWSEVAGSDGFKTLQPEQQDQARRQYFDEVVAPQVPQEHVTMAWDAFSTDSGMGRRELPKDVAPSTAGAGRGSLNPVEVTPATPTKGRSGSVLENVILDDPQLDPELNRQAMLQSRSPNSVMFTAGRGKQDADQAIEQGKRSPVQEMRETKPIQERSFIRAAGDTAIGLTQGALGMAKGVADNINAGDNPVSDFYEGAIKAGDRLKSDDLRNQQVKRDAEIYQAGKNGGEVGEARASFNSMFSFPGAGMDVVARGAGSMIPTVGLGLAGAGTKLMGATNALSNAGDAASQTADALRQLPPSAWQKSEDYRAMVNEGASHEDAVSKLAPWLALPAQIAGGVTGFITGSTGLEKVLAGKAVGNSVAQRAGRAGVELLGEQAETLAPQMVGNVAVGGLDGTTGITKGLGRAAVETAAGSLPGSALAAKSVATPDAQPSAEQIARQKGFLVREQRIKTLTDAGDTATADFLQKKHDRLTAIEEVDGELQRMPSTPEFANSYRTLRGTGMKPAEAAARSAVTTTFQGAAVTAGIPDAAMATALEQANGMPLDEVPAFLQKFTAALEKRGLAQLGAVNLSEQLETARDDAIEAAMGAVYPQGDIRNDMNDVLAMEGQAASEAVDLQPNQALYVESPTPVATQSVATTQVASGSKQPWQMTRNEWNKHNFDENEHRGLPADYFSGHEFNAEKAGTSLINKTPSGIEIRQGGYGVAYAFDGDKNVGMGDGKAFVVKPEYQKQGIGKSLLKATYTGKPIGSRTSAGQSLVNSFHEKETARAIADGKTVPAEVLADYPDLQLTNTPAASTQSAQTEVVPASQTAPVKVNPTNSSQTPASWVIKEKATGAVIMETFDQKAVNALNTSKYEAVPINTHLQGLNAKVTAQAPAPVTPPAQSVTGEGAGGSRPTQVATKPAPKPFAELPDLAPEQQQQLERSIAADSEREYQQSVKESIQVRLGLVKPTETNTKKTPLKSFLQQYGIAPVHTSDIAGKNRFKANQMLPATFRAGGLDLDSLVEQAIERGFMTEADRGDQGKLISMIQSEIAGDAQVSTEFADDDAAAQTERAQRREIEGEADKLGLPYSADTSTDQLASMVNRVQTRLEKEVGVSWNGRGTLKSERVLTNAREVAARIERKRAQYRRELAQFAEATIAEQDALLELLQDADGNPIIVRSADLQAEQAWAEINGTWDDQNGKPDTGAAGNSQENSALTGRQPEEGIGNGAQAGPQEQRGGDGASDQSQEGSAGSSEGLTATTPEQLKADEERATQAEKAAKTKKRTDDELARKAQERKDIAARSESAADSFVLGGDAMENLTGQGNMFDEPAQPEVRPAPPAGQPPASDAEVIAKTVERFDRLGIKGVERKQSVIEALASQWGMTTDEVAEMPEVQAALRKSPTKGSKTAATERFVQGVMQQGLDAVAAERGETKPATEGKPAKIPSPAELRAQADLQAALADLGDILGRNTRMNMMPEQEAKILPVMVKVFDAAFRLGYHKFMDAAKFALDKIRAALGSEVADDITLEHLQGAYISMSSGKTGVDGIRAVSNIESKDEVDAHTAQTDNERKENSNAPSTDSRVERDRQGAATEPAVGDPVSTEPRGTDEATPQTGRRTHRGSGRGQLDGIGLSSGGAAAAGNGSDQRVPGRDAESELASVTTGDQFSERGASIGISGIPPEPIPAKSVAKAAQSFDDALTKSRAQKAATNVKPITGDLQNIRDTLPQLLPNQQEDVHLAEQRFAKADGYGMLFTNGTGTGKTFSGLGIIKRHELQGKTNTLILAPDSKIASDWIKSGKLLGLNISELADTKDAGRGIVITTYANFGANDATATRQWDLVVADEAHTLMQDKDGTPTSYLYALRAITYHPDGAGIRHSMLNRDKLDKAKALGDEIEAFERMVASDNTTDAQRNKWEAKSEALQSELGDLRKTLDEAMKAMKAEVAARQGATRPRLVALSATPFAYEKSIDWGNGYLFDYNAGRGDESKEFRGYNAGSNREQYFMQHFGYRMRTGKLTAPEGKVDSGTLQRQWNAGLKTSGALSGRMLDVVPDYDRRFVTVDSAIGNRIDEALEWLSEQRKAQPKDDRGFSDLSDAINEQFKYLQKRYLLEAIKATEVIPIVKAHMAMGRKVVVFHDYKKGGGFNPFRVTGGEPQLNAAIEAFNVKFGDLVNSNLGSMDSPIEVFGRELPGTLLINGDQKKGDLLKRYELFQDDASGPQVMLVQSAKNKGWSGHDTTGKHQRVLINLGQPTAPTLAIQQEGRIYRTGQASDAIMRYLNTGTNWERWTFASTIAGRASTAENLGMGEMARALKDSFIQSFEESDTYAPGHEGEGKGGKERDKAANDAVTEYDRAKSMYFATQKKNSRTKAQEGVDYFATPEPVGLKMVQWLDARPDESTLEPSAGHGAISRWLPDVTKRTVVEPSLALRSRLALAMNPNEDRIIAGTFEDLDVTNKYDGIVMNPPFGTAGRTAVDHIAKAATHLRDGGRIVALLPMGSATAKFDKWFYESSEKATKPIFTHPTLGPIYKGDTITTGAAWAKTAKVVGMLAGSDGVVALKVEGTTGNTSASPNSWKTVEPTGKRTESFKPAEGLYLVASIQLPTVTFERAGTAVATRIVVIEKQMDSTKALASGLHDRDFSGTSDITELFNQLENIEMPKRDLAAPAEPAASAKAEKPARAPKPAAAPAAAVGDQISLGGKQYPVEVYTTNAGKELRGVWVGSKAEALKYGSSTFEKRGKGFFVRERDFPKAGTTDDFDAPMLSRGGATGQTTQQVQAQVDTLAKTWANAPKIVVVQSTTDLSIDAPTDARGLYFRKTVYVVADNNATAREVAQTLGHEAIAHHGLREMLGRNDWLKLMGNIQLALASGNKPLNAIRDELRKSYVDEKGVYNLNKNQESDEITARAVESAIDPETGEFRPGFGFMKSVYAKLAQFLRDIGVNVMFTNLELQGLLVSSLEGLQTGARTNGVGVSGAPVYSRSPMKSIDANIKRGLDALNNSLNGKTTVHRAMFRNGLGWVDFVWGSEGQLKTSGKTKGAMGLSHILEARQRKDGMSERQANDLMNDIVRAIAGGSEFDRKETEASTRVGVASDKTIVWLAKSPGSNAWVVTGYEKNPDGADAGRATSAPTSVTASLTRDDRVAGFDGIVPQNDFDGNEGAFARGPSPQANLFQPTGWSMPDSTKTDRIIYELQDGRVDLKRAQAAIEQTGQQIIEKWDARLAETLYPGRVAYRSKAFLDTEVKPLLEAMARQNLGMDELADYLHARGAEERNKQIAKVNPAMPDGGAGTNTKGDLMTNQAARDYLANIRQARLQVLDAMAKRVDAITGGTRALLVTEGLEKQITIDAWEGAYKNYVPMFRDEAEAGAPHPQGSGFSVRGSASKRATGSTKEVTNILAHVLMQREAAITRAEKNRVGLALYGQAMSHPNPEFWTTIKPSMKPAQIAAELMAMGVDPMTAQVGMEGVPTIRTVDPTTGKVVDRPNPMYKSLPGAIPLRVNGEDRVLMINVTGERGARMAASLKNMDGLTELDIAGNIVGKSTRWLASVNTQYNPAFGLTNLTRDVLGGVIHLGNTELRGKALKVLLKTPVAIVGIARELASGGQSGKWQTLYRQFQADGGQTGFKENFRDPNERAKAIESELKGLGRASWNPSWAAHAMLSLLDGFNTTLENAVRLSAYSEALDKGISRANAARLGRELTVDFNRKGRTGAELGPMYAFFNASVQGTNRSIQAIKGPTGPMIIAGGLGLGVAQALMLMMAGYDEDEIPEFVKARALVIPLFGKEKSYITIPYPLGLHVIPNTGRVLTELALNGGKDMGKRTGEAIGEIAGAFNPLGGGNIFTADGALKTVAPTVIDPLIEMGFNKNFAGNSIQRQSYGGERDNRPGVARTKEATMKTTTGQAYMEISKAINTMTGGTDYEKGAASPTPEMIRYMAQTVGGGVLRELEKTVNASTAANRGEPVKPSGIPVVGRFYGEVDNNQVQTSRYFKTGDKLAKMDSSFQSMVKAGDGEAVQAFVEKNPDVALVKLHHKVGTSIAQLNKLAVQTVGNPEASAQIDQARVGLMSALNQAAENAGKATRKATLADMIKAKIKAPAEVEN